MEIRNQILEAMDQKLEKVEVDGWPVPVFIPDIGAATKYAWDEQLLLLPKEDAPDFDPLQFHKLKCWLLVRSLCDENGKKIFEDDDEDLLKKKSNKIIENLFNKVAEKNILLPKDVDKLEKN